jgi:hypothetical protein
MNSFNTICKEGKKPKRYKEHSCCERKEEEEEEMY